ncbi:hypothetical protein [Duganella sp. Root1480D1]|uniref:hypothetical protein n=1 Tax=Duganella sp. Root1480D1 TaxID=1736471 RepID=UPI00070EC4AC|nr:hypothetical protein [Duganella sp. Root1480D1]KQZ44951.1 hypothetical protein ASD58_01480 [Duganella sp. Root1480D1]
MTRSSITLADANKLLRSIFDLPVSLPWKGHGSAIFLELGKLAPLSRSKQRRQNGEVTIYIGWEWRVEQGCRVLYGSSNSRPQIDDCLDGLLGATIKSIAIEGRVPELVIEFSNDQRLISAAMCTDISEWSVRLPGAAWIDCDRGTVYFGDGEAIGLSQEVDMKFEHAQRTTQRWGIPSSAGLVGHCSDCVSMVRIDGDAAFLDYGVCTSADSPFDGRIVNMCSGCSFFVASEAP